MTSLFQPRRRVEESTAEGGADSSATRDRTVTTLLRLVAALRAQAPVEPGAKFVEDLRSRLMLQAQTALKPDTPTRGKLRSITGPTRPRR